MKITLYILIGLGLIYGTLVLIDALNGPDATAGDTQKALSYIEANKLEKPPLDFYHDGCTSAPDWLPWHNLKPACLNHDIAYWAGGSEELKQQADLKLKTDILDSGPLGFLLSPIFYYSITLLGNNIFSEILGSTWGYGHVQK